MMEKGRLSPGGGRPSPPLLMTEVEKFLVGITARLATWANISGLKDHYGKYNVVQRDQILSKQMKRQSVVRLKLPLSMSKISC